MASAEEVVAIILKVDAKRSVVVIVTHLVVGKTSITSVT